MWYIYIARCADTSLYTGITKDLKRRLREHNTNDMKGSKYTRTKRPVTVVYKETTETQSQALKREAAIKRLSRRQKERLTDGKLHGSINIG